MWTLINREFIGQPLILKDLDSKQIYILGNIDFAGDLDYAWLDTHVIRTIQRRFRAILKKSVPRQFEYDGHVRGPWAHYVHYKMLDQSIVGASKWHQDLHGGYEMKDQWIVAWSNIKPTHFKLKGKDKLIKPKNEEVVLFNNKAFLHKMPKLTDDEKLNRFFTRAYPVGVL